jgi:hypothetical protein
MLLPLPYRSTFGLTKLQLNCFVGPLTSDGCSSLTDFACHCQKGPALLASVQPCVEGACSAADQAAAISAVESTCSAAGVPISIPDSASSAATSEATVVTATSEVSTTVVTATSEATSAAASAVSSAISGGNATTSATLSQFTGGAAQATQAVGILGAAALAMLAL